MKSILVVYLICISLLAKGETLSALEIMKQTYSESQYLGFAVGNHSSIKALIDMETFLLEVVKDDMDFRYIYLESPAELEFALHELSINNASISEIESYVGTYWFKRIKASPQLAYFYTSVLSKIQLINKDRPHAPIVIVPIDSYNTERNKADTKKILEGGNFYLFGASIAREMETAENFLDYAVLHPTKKAAIFYHQAHILKSLIAHGFILDDEGNPNFYTSQHLGWWNFAAEALPELKGKMKVILFNEKDNEYNANAIIDTSMFLPTAFNQGSGRIILGNKIKSKDLFLQDSYLYRYRAETIVFPEEAQDIFDAFVDYN